MKSSRMIKGINQVCFTKYRAKDLIDYDTDLNNLKDNLKNIKVPFKIYNVDGYFVAVDNSEEIKMNALKIKRNLIKEYAGSHFTFMINFLEGGYEDYVEKNWEKIAYKNSFGYSRLRDAFKRSMNAKYDIMKICERTIEYVNEEFKRSNNV